VAKGQLHNRETTHKCGYGLDLNPESGRFQGYDLNAAPLKCSEYFKQI